MSRSLGQSRSSLRPSERAPVATCAFFVPALAPLDLPPATGDHATPGCPRQGSGSSSRFRCETGRRGTFARFADAPRCCLRLPRLPRRDACAASPDRRLGPCENAIPVSCGACILPVCIKYKIDTLDLLCAAIYFLIHTNRNTQVERTIIMTNILGIERAYFCSVLGEYRDPHYKMLGWLTSAKGGFLTDLTCKQDRRRMFTSSRPIRAESGQSADLRHIQHSAAETPRTRCGRQA